MIRISVLSYDGPCLKSPQLDHVAGNGERLECAENFRFLANSFAIYLDLLTIYGRIGVGHHCVLAFCRLGFAGPGRHFYCAGRRGWLLVNLNAHMGR